VRFCRGGAVVVEVVNDKSTAVSGQVNIELEEEGYQAGGGEVAGGEGKEDIAFGVDEFEESLGSEL
jgi:hypothetical protein